MYSTLIAELWGVVGCEGKARCRAAQQTRSPLEVPDGGRGVDGDVIELVENFESGKLRTNTEHHYTPGSSDKRRNLVLQATSIATNKSRKLHKPPSEKGCRLFKTARSSDVLHINHQICPMFFCV